MNELLKIEGTIELQLLSAEGRLKEYRVFPNLITEVGKRLYIETAAGVAGAPLAPTGIRLGTGATDGVPALEIYLPGSGRAFDAGYPIGSAVFGARRVTYQVSYSTTPVASAITEAALVNDDISADVAPAAGSVLARSLFPEPVNKTINDTLVVSWHHDLA